ncbi:unnamed protein product [Polarella glacialis]|uniref:CCHC-type domain-containing protein n=2 Tax=Polarella glacialis TaxID=89957 RepID=A0A813H1T3_POLGL|nr:unnamed protein product [Polarella glacialis]
MEIDSQQLVRTTSPPVLGQGEPERKLPAFTGADKDWPEWSYDAKADLIFWGVMSEADFACVEASQEPLAVPRDPEFANQAARLWIMLLRSCKGNAKMLVRRAGRGNGAEAWRLLWRRFSRAGDEDAMHVMSWLMKYDFGDMSQCLDRLSRLDVLVQSYNASNPIEEIPEALIKTVLKERLPEPLRSHLALVVTSRTGLLELIARVEEYLQQRKPFDDEYVLPNYHQARDAEVKPPQPADSEPSVPMDPSMLSWIAAMKGKGKGKGKSKMKGSHPSSKGSPFAGSSTDAWSQQWSSPWPSWGDADDDQDGATVDWSVQCWGCGGWGHRERVCPSKGHGRGISLLSRVAGDELTLPAAGVVSKDAEKEMLQIDFGKNPWLLNVTEVKNPQQILDLKTLEEADEAQADETK